MTFNATRREFLVGAGVLATTAAFPALAQDKPKLRFSAVFSEQDIRADMMKMFADAIKDDFVFEGYYGGNLFKQGTELVALQRGNLEMGNIAPQDISKQIPAWSIVTAAYLFRDAAHLKTFFAGELGAEMKKMTEDQLGVQVLGPTYFGVRQVGLKPDKKINTPADMAGIKLRMPGGDAWQFLGTALGANPVADGLCRGLYRPADRRDRRPGQSAAERREHEVLRGHVADRADLASRRLRPARPCRRRCGTTWAPRSRRIPGRRRRGHRLEHARSTSRARRNWSRSSRARASKSTSPMSPRSASTRRRNIWPRTSPRTGRPA